MPSKIEYVDETWNPMSGCTKISPGCTHCYAERMARRLAGRFGYPEAPHHFDVTLHPDRLDEPLRRKKPTRYLVCSMGDLFHEDMEYEWLDKVFAVMGCRQRHTYLVLTKRPQLMKKYLLAERGGGRDTRDKIDEASWDEFGWGDPWSDSITELWPLPNVWPGVTVENQDETWRVDELVKIPAAKHWVSLEPMLGPVDLIAGVPCCVCHGTGEGLGDTDCPVCYGDGYERRLDWVVLGGETGPGARPCNPGWVRKVRDDCVAAGVDFFFKGWGAWIPIGEEPPDTDIQGDHGFLSMSGIVKGTRIEYVDGQGKLRDTNELSDFNLPNDWALIARVGKKAAGRLLDGQTWDEMPETDV